jgi:hypothetical protein
MTPWLFVRRWRAGRNWLENKNLTKRTAISGTARATEGRSTAVSDDVPPKPGMNLSLAGTISARRGFRYTRRPRPEVAASLLVLGCAAASTFCEGSAIHARPEAPHRKKAENNQANEDVDPLFPIEIRVKTNDRSEKILSEFQHGRYAYDDSNARPSSD